MALSVLFNANYGASQVVLPPRFGTPRLVRVTPADRVVPLIYTQIQDPYVSFTRSPLPNFSRIIGQQQLLARVLNVPLNLWPLRMALKEPLRVNVARLIDTTWFPVPAPVIDLNTLKPLKATVPYKVTQSATSFLFGPDLPTNYTPPLPTVPISVDMAPLRAKYEVPSIRFAPSLFYGLDFPIPPLAIDVVSVPISNYGEQPKPYVSGPSLLFGLDLPVVAPPLALDIVSVPLFAYGEQPKPYLSGPTLIFGYDRGVTLPIDIISSPLVALKDQPNFRRHIEEAFKRSNIVVPPPAFLSPLFLNVLRSIKHDPRDLPLVTSGVSRPFVWLFPAPPVSPCALGIGIVPIYYTSPGPNVVPVETLTPGVLPWGWANWTDVVPVCVQPPGPNVVPVYEAPTTVPRVKIRAARPEM